MSKYFDWKNDIKQDELKQVIDIIKKDGIIIFPTETVYGIGGNALSKNVIKKIYEVKKRPQEKALTVLVKNKQEIEKYAVISNDIERKIIENFMPGPITIILKKKTNSIRELVTGNNETVGIRISNNIILKEILNRCDIPILAPSANISGRKSAIKLEEIRSDFEGKIDAFIDGGICKEKVPSTIVQVIDDKVTILRQGVISIEEINKKIYM